MLYFHRKLCERIGAMSKTLWCSRFYINKGITGHNPGDPVGTHKGKHILFIFDSKLKLQENITILHTCTVVIPRCYIKQLIT